MKLILDQLIFIYLVIVFAYCKQTLWAVLVAGSNSYDNYRHQADKQAGVPGFFKFFTFTPFKRGEYYSLDDIANNEKNPFPGTIVNYLGGPDVYKGVPKDYVGKELTPENFLELLKGGEPIKGKKTLKSTSEDNVFIYFTDHGGKGTICFPGMVKLPVDDLMNALKYMYDHKMYKEMVFYLEACESGSMFDNHLDPSWNIYGATASNPTQSSYACDFSEDHKAYLNDCWSRNYLNDTRWAMNNKAMNTRTYGEQADWIKKRTTESPACVYGDLNIQNETLDQFQGESAFKSQEIGQISRNNSKRGVPQRLVKLRLLEYEVEWSTNEEERTKNQQELDNYLEEMKKIDNIWRNFAKNLKISLRNDIGTPYCHQHPEKTDPECLKRNLEISERLCGKFNEWGLQYFYLLSKSCQLGISQSRIISELSNICEE